MPVFLRKRHHELPELMDNPQADLKKLHQTYAHFFWVNRVISRWHYIFESHIHANIKNINSVIRILDVGCGGGDLALLLSNKLRSLGREHQIVGIDPDDRAISFAQKQVSRPEINFEARSLDDEFRLGNSYDFVISNHVLHHLSDTHIPDFLKLSRSLSHGKVIHSDIRRSDLAFIGYPLLSMWTAWNSFLMVDGMRSIRRSFTKAEITDLAGPHWKVIQYPLFRWVLIYEH